jgi:hypothetical protein
MQITRSGMILFIKHPKTQNAKLYRLASHIETPENL